MDSPIIHVIWLAVAGGITLFLPGAALLVWLPQPDMDFPQQAGRALGLSMALTALGALITFLTGLQLTGGSMVAICCCLAVLTAIGWIRRKQTWHFSRSVLIGIGITVLTGAGFLAWRFYQARGLILPAWVDSVHHVLIVQAILDRGGLPASLAPYIPVPMYYHFGFHALAAAFSFWSRLSADQAVLVLGQVLMAVMGLAVYRLAAVLWKDTGKGVLCGVTSALLVTFVSHMPGYYLTWGRYTLLAGLILLALAIAEVLELVNQRTESSGLTKRADVDEPEAPAAATMPGKPRWFSVSLVVALLTSGLLLTHYLAAILLALFLLLQGIRFLWDDLRMRRINLECWLPLVGGVALGTLLAFPWLVWVFSFAYRSFTVNALLPAQPGLQGYASYLWDLAGPQQNYFLLLLGILGLVLAFIRSSVRVFSAWCAVFIFLCLPIGIQLGPLRPDIMVMMVFLPAVLLGGYLLVSAGEAACKFALRPNWSAGVTAFAVGLLCLWGIRQTGSIINPVTILVNQADRQALDWIDKNLPIDARFYINTTPWQGATYRGVDGGWWILSLTGRQILLPPVVYGWGQPAYISQVNAWAMQASQITGCSDAFWQLVKVSGVNYIYLHAGVGSLQPSGLVGCSGIEPVYDKAGIAIYHISNP